MAFSFGEDLQQKLNQLKIKLMKMILLSTEPPSGDPMQERPNFFFSRENQDCAIAHKTDGGFLNAWWIAQVSIV